MTKPNVNEAEKYTPSMEWVFPDKLFNIPQWGKNSLVEISELQTQWGYLKLQGKEDC